MVDTLFRKFGADLLEQFMKSVSGLCPLDLSASVTSQELRLSCLFFQWYFEVHWFYE